MVHNCTVSIKFDGTRFKEDLRNEMAKRLIDSSRLLTHDEMYVEIADEMCNNLSKYIEVEDD